MRLHKFAAVGLAAVVLSGMNVADAAAPIFKGTYAGNTTNSGEEPEDVTLVVKKRVGRTGLWVMKFSVNQGGDCGTLIYNNTTYPAVMPVKVKRRDDGQKSFTIKDDKSFPGTTVFWTRGTWSTSDVVVGKFSQVACDGEPDNWIVYGQH